MKPIFLVRKPCKKKRLVAHIWTGEDTACRMWSTGGIPHKERYETSIDQRGAPICTMCRANAARSPEAQP